MNPALQKLMNKGTAPITGVPTQAPAAPITPPVVPMNSRPMQPATSGVPAGLFRGMKDARPSTDAQYFVPGDYICRVDKCKITKNRKQENIAVFEFTVVHVFDCPTGAIRVGSVCSYVVNEKSDYFCGDIKAFIATMMETSADLVDDVMAEKIFQDEQPLSGFLVHVAAVSRPNQKTGIPYTKTSFRSYVSATDALQVLTPDAVNRFFPGGVLEKLAQMEAAS